MSAYATKTARKYTPLETSRAVVPSDPAAATRSATRNLRRHWWRAARRIAALLLVDAIAFIVARMVIHRVMDGALIPAWGWPMSALLTEWPLAMAFFVGTTVAGSYGSGDVRRHSGRLAVAGAIAAALPLWSMLWARPFSQVFELYVASFIPMAATLVTLRVGFDALERRMAHTGRGDTLARTVLVGRAADCIEQRASSALGRRAGFEVIGVVEPKAPTHPGTLGTVDDLERILREHRADTVVLCGFPDAMTTTRVLRAAALAECMVLAAARELELPGVRPEVVRQEGKALLELRPATLRAEQLALKRTMDIVGAAVGLVLLAPLLVLIVAIIRLDSHGPALFAHRRLGRHGRPIRCYKFRSMYVDAEARLLADPALFRRYVENDYKLPEELDTRITPVGRFLRRTSLDELPQLWNVLKGEMSLVGPRPIVPDEIRHYNREGALFLSLKPGLTGRWQVSGRSTIQYPERAAVELEYVERWSLWQDIGILLRTVPAVLVARGAH